MHRIALLFLAIGLWSFAGAADREPEPIAIIGTGEVGSALGVSWGALGHPIIYGSRSPASDKTQDLVRRSGNARAVLPNEVANHANVIVLALPFQPALDLLPGLGNVDGKIVIDPINALRFDGQLQRVDVADERLAEQFQALVPKAHVVKALNTINARYMTPNRDFDGPISILLAGDNVPAKQRVASLIKELDLDPVDVGALFNARYVEAMAPLYVYMNVFARAPGGFEFAISRKSIRDDN